MIVLSHQKKILISLPDALLTEVDSLATAQKINRSEFVREAMRRYVDEQKSASLNQALRKGYEQMADINLEIAEFCLEADNIQQQSYEEKLAECE
jgi:CopG family transcriptional regulator/antitoxin EndoAI